ncbi:MAG: ribonuclease J [Armatimonadota bacterium]|nr:ribonuclease J [bacterium]
MTNTSGKLQIIPLGGVMEIGKNMTAYVYNDQILIVDAGLMFPEEEMLGVDIVIPDITYLEENADKVLGIVLTHGHEDHIGALPYVLRRLDVPVYGTPLTLGFVSNKLSEHHLADVARLNVVKSGDIVELGDFTVEFVRVSHSIPDASGLVINTPVGTIVQSSDFKFDQTPIDGHLADMSRLAKVGEEGVLALLCDSTNVEKTGFTPSESLVGETFEKIFKTASGRIIIAAFASNIHRLQQVYNLAAKLGRRVAVVGRSMAENSRIAEELGYLKVPEGTRLRVEDTDSLDPSEVVIMTTGSQGEPLSALSRMASDEHKHIKIGEGDTVVISATPIPGNEDLVLRTINQLFKRGADVVYEPFAHVHVSGHGNQEDIRLMLNLLKPKFVIPVHGEQRHFAKFIEVADGIGYSHERLFKLYPGDVFQTDGETAEISGKVESGSVMVDGLGVGDVEDVVLRDRQHLAQDGVVIVVVGVDLSDREVVTGPDIFSRGFVGEEYGEEIIEEARDVVLAKVEEFISDDSLEALDDVKAACRKVLAKFIYDRTHRRPVIVPILMEV